MNRSISRGTLKRHGTRYRWNGFLCALLMGAVPASSIAQTATDTRTQTKPVVDFSTALSTKPAKLGPALPGACTTGDIFFKSPAPPGQNLYGCTATNTWSLEITGGGVTTVSQLTDFAVTLASPTTLTIGAFCAPGNPCNVRFGSVVYAILNSATVTLTAGTGTAFIYIASSGQFTVGHNLTLTCNSGCVAQSGVTSFPADSIPLFTWTSSGGIWDVAGHVDFRSFLSTKSVTSGIGLLSSDVSGVASLSLDTTVVGLRVATPATATTACTTGSWSTDSGFFYVCTALNTWKRTAIASW
jgi:hypothetical protein